MDLKPMIYSTPRTPSVFLEQSHIVKPVVSQEVVDSRNYRKVGHRYVRTGLKLGLKDLQEFRDKALELHFVLILKAPPMSGH